MGLLQAAGESPNRPAASDRLDGRRDPSSEAAALGGATARPRVSARSASRRNCGPVFATSGTVQKREGGVDEIGGIPYFSSMDPYPVSALIRAG